MSNTRPHDERRRMRKLWQKVHLYVGLFAGTVLAVLGATGSLLVFGNAIDRMLNPELAAAAEHAPVVTPDEVVEVIERRYGVPPLALFTPEEGRGTFRALAREHGTDSGGIHEILIDSSTGKILADRLRGTYFVSIVHALHSELLLGRAGGFILAGIGILTLVSLGSGIYLWWPRGGAFRRAFKFHWHSHAPAMNFEIHRVSGFYLAGVLLVIVVSGLYLTLPGPFTAAVSAVARVTPWPENIVSSATTSQGSRLQLADIGLSLERHRPGATITSYSFPASSQDAYEVYFRDPPSAVDAHGHGTVWIDQYSGLVLHARERTELGAGDRFLDLQIRLHNGEVLGPAGEALVFVTGLSMPLLYGTGLYLWWIRRPRARVVPAGRSQGTGMGRLG